MTTLSVFEDVTGASAAWLYFDFFVNEKNLFLQQSLIVFLSCKNIEKSVLLKSSSTLGPLVNRYWNG